MTDTRTHKTYEDGSIHYRHYVERSHEIRAKAALGGIAAIWRKLRSVFGGKDATPPAAEPVPAKRRLHVERGKDRRVVGRLLPSPDMPKDAAGMGLGREVR